MGGTDDPSNLITVNLKQHANLHRILYEVHKKQEDWLAWKGLSASISKEEVIKMKQILSNKNRVVTEKQKQKTANTLSKTWKITSPDGETFIVKNLYRWCLDRNISSANMSRNQVRGWSCQKIA